jgi:carboxy-cis,cis-muconate cyclase
VYSTDDMGNAVWAHSYDRETKTAQTLQYLAAPEGANPRHLAAHPNGGWVYVIYEEANSLAVYKRDDKTGLLTDEKTTFSLLPAGMFILFPCCKIRDCICTNAPLPRFHKHILLLGR